MGGWLVRFSGLAAGAMSALERFPVAVIALAAFALFNNLAIADVITPAPGVIERAAMALFSRLGGKISTDNLSILYGDFVLLLRREDWPD